MSMTEPETPITAPPGVPAKKPARTRRKYMARMKAAPKPAEADAWLAGITLDTCPEGCSEKGCVISGDIYAHPGKAGLQAIYRTKPEVMARFDKAKRYLGIGRK